MGEGVLASFSQVTDAGAIRVRRVAGFSKSFAVIPLGGGIVVGGRSISCRKRRALVLREIDHYGILTWRFVRQLEERVPDFRRTIDAIQQFPNRLLSYPDGSLDYAFHPNTDPLWQAMMFQKRKLHVRQTNLGSFAALPPFRGSPRLRHYALTSSDEHEQRVHPGGILFFAPGVLRDDYPEQLDLTHLDLNIFFHRRIRRDDMHCLVSAIQEWHGSVCGSGLFGEGPIGQLSDGMEFQGRRAQFWFDASRTGQRTINWLILSLLNATYDVLLPSGFIFNEVENLAKYGVVASDEKVVHLALRAAGQSSDAGSPPVESSRLPPGLVQYAGVRSDSFTILQTPSFEWESFRLAVYFEDWPNREQQRDLRTLLVAWSQVALAGGFGGAGGAFLRPLVFLKKQQAALLCGDPRDTDPEIAVPVLIRLLENYASGTLAIEAVVFGLDPTMNMVF